MMRFFLIVVFLPLTSIFMAAQEVLNVDFNDCDAADNVGLQDGVLVGNPGCECGMEGQSLAFDGLNDFVRFPSEAASFLNSNFTISFYLKVDNNQSDPVDIFSVEKSCVIDSSFSIKYFPFTNQLVATLGVTPSRRTLSMGRLHPDKCWHFVTLTRSENELILYIEGEQMDVGLIGSSFVVSPQVNFLLGNGPCDPDSKQLLRGNIDVLQVYNRVLNLAEVNALNRFADEVLTRDRTVIRGEDFTVEMGATCSDNIRWTPSDGVSSSTALEPTITPDEDLTYFYTADYGTCVAMDSINVVLIDASELACDDLLLPTAFTPNGDGLNESYGISVNENLDVELISFEIFDRWGAKVFRTNDISEKWDGKISGQSTNSTSMIYKVRYICDGEERFISGSFVILQ